MVVLNDHDVRTLTESLEELRLIDPIADPEAFISASQLWAGKLSDPYRREIQRFRRFGSPEGALLISNIPIGEIPPTPRRPIEAIGLAPVAVCSQAVLLGELGEQVGYRPEFGGGIYQVIAPVQSDELEQISTSSRAALERHIETAWSRHRPDRVALLCVRPDHLKVAGTPISPSWRIVKALAPEMIAVLREPRFKMKVDRSYLRGDGYTQDIWNKGIAVLQGSVENPDMQIDIAEAGVVDPQDSVAEAALAEFSRVACEVEEVVRLDAGQMVIVDNHKALHGRTPFTARYDGQDRILLRAFLLRSLYPSESVRPDNGRILEPDYRELPVVEPTFNVGAIRATDNRTTVVHARGY